MSESGHKTREPGKARNRYVTLSDGLTMLPLDLRIIGLEGDRVGVYDLSFDDCCCAVRNIADLALVSGKGIAFIVVAVFIDAENPSSEASGGWTDQGSGVERVGKGIAGGTSTSEEWDWISVAGRLVVSTLRPRPSASDGVTPSRSFFCSACWVVSLEPEPDEDRSSSTSAGKANTGPRGLLLLLAVEKAVVRERRGIPMRGENAAVLAC